MIITVSQQSQIKIDAQGMKTTKTHMLSCAILCKILADGWDSMKYVHNAVPACRLKHISWHAPPPNPLSLKTACSNMSSSITRHPFFFWTQKPITTLSSLRLHPQCYHLHSFTNYPAVKHVATVAADQTTVCKSAWFIPKFQKHT